MSISETNELKTKESPAEVKETQFHKPKIGVAKSFMKKILTVYKMVLNSEDLEFHRFLSILQKTPEQRSLKDIAVIKAHLENTDLATKFRHDSTDEELLVKMLYFCSRHMSYTYLSANKTLFKIGDIGDKFFLILKGRIGIFKPMSRNDKFTSKQYFDCLVSLREENEKFLLKLTIDANMAAYPVDINDIDEINEIYFKINYRKMLLTRSKIAQIRKLFENCNIDPKLYNLDLNELFFLEQNPKSSDQYFSLIQKQLRMINESNNFINKVEYYRYLENEFQSKFVTLFDYNHFLDLSTGRYFGDYALDQKTTRSATIKTMEDTHFGYLEVDNYNEFLGIEKQKLNMREISFLTENFFFIPVNKKTFEEKYFQHFIFEEHFKGDILIKENEISEFIFFIKDGDVEVGMNKSAYEINKQLTLIEKRNVKGVKIPWEECHQIKNDTKFILTSLSKRKCIKLFYTGSKETLGIESYYTGIESLSQAKVISEKLKLYKIEYKNLTKILQDEKECVRFLEDYAIKKIETYIGRIITTFNSMLMMIDQADFNTLEEERIRNRKSHRYSNDFVPKIKTLCLGTHEFISGKINEMKKHYKSIDEAKDNNNIINNNNMTMCNLNPHQVGEHRKSLQEVMPLLTERVSSKMTLDPKLSGRDTCNYENHLMNQIKKQLNNFRMSCLSESKKIWKTRMKNRTDNSSEISTLVQKSSVMPTLTEESLASPANSSNKIRKQIQMINFPNVAGTNLNSKNKSTSINNLTIQTPRNETERIMCNVNASYRKNMTSTRNEPKHTSRLKLSLEKKNRYSIFDEFKIPMRPNCKNMQENLIGNEIVSNNISQSNCREGNAIVYVFHSRKSKISSKELLEKMKKNVDYKKAIREKANLIQTLFGN